MTKVHVLAVGDFGAAVAERLQRGHHDVEVTSDREGPLRFPASWPVADVRILASWREVPALSELVDARSADWRTTWLPVVAEHPRLRIGPLVVPGEEPATAASAAAAPSTSATARSRPPCTPTTKPTPRRVPAASCHSTPLWLRAWRSTCCGGWRAPGAWGRTPGPYATGTCWNST